MPLIDPTLVIIPPRQRTKPDDGTVADLARSISEKGQIQPIVLRSAPEGLTLVVGGRRLAACTSLKREVWYELFSDLSPEDASEVELEENLKREDLPWRDTVAALGLIRAIHERKDPPWSIARTAERLSVDPSWVYKLLIIHKNLASPLLESATDIGHAYSILVRASERRAASIVGEIAEQSARIFGTSGVPIESTEPSASVGGVALSDVAAATPAMVEGSEVSGGASLGGSGGSTTPAATGVAPPPRPAPSAPIILANFLEWAPLYAGPKFNLLHCDFPYGIDYTHFAHSIREPTYTSDPDIYWHLIDRLVTQTDRLASYSAHMIFWFSMEFYDETRRKLSAGGWNVQAHPLIWHKTDHAGIAPGRGQYPRRVYETAFLCSRGQRPLLKAGDNAYGCPTTANALHPSQKPEPMLRHFFSMLVDSVTDFLDPTCGSGSAIRAAEDSGARSVLGLELNPDYASAALSATLRARIMREATR